MTATREIVTDKRDQFAFHDDIAYLRETKRGLTRATVEEISGFKEEPDWMLQFRLRAFEHFMKRPMPTWTDGLDRIDFDKIVYYRKPSQREEKSWDDVPEQIKATFERLGIPEAERKFLAGVGAQYDSEVVYHSVREELSKIGVVFMGTDQALKEYPEIFRKHFGTIVPPEDNKFAALNSAVWSGGSFVYVPKGVEVPLPLQAYFRINGENTGQFERTLIVVEEGAKVHYIEGCTAPIYATDSLHAAVVEVVALPGSKVRYTTIQNWSNDVYNLVTKRAHAYENSTVESAVAVLNAAEPALQGAPLGRARQVWFGTDPRCELRLHGARLEWRGEALMEAAEVRIRGPHNLENAMAAAAAALARDVDTDAVREGLASFTGVPHRLERVAEIGGVTYVNDSKATNVTAAAAALRSFERVHAILGGSLKGGGFEPLSATVEAHCRACYLIGEAQERLAEDLASAGVPLHRCGTLERAVAAASSNAQPGDVVLLAPACASFDQYEDFEARGEHFRDLVSGLGERP